MEGARGPCGLEKEWTGLSGNEVWREPEDRVALRKRVNRVASIVYGIVDSRIYNFLCFPDNIHQFTFL